jgi:hypothetical protein
MRRFGRTIAVVGVLVLTVLGLDAGLAAADAVVLTLSATISANGTTILVVAPGCQPTPPGISEIVLQGRNATTGEIGEGAVAVGGFNTPGQGSVVIPPGTPINSFLISVSCNGGTLTGSQAFALGSAATPVATQPNFTG